MMRFVNALVVLALSVVTVSALVSAPVHGATFFDNSKDQACKGANLTGGEACDASAGKSLSNVIRTAINILSVVVGIIAVVMIIVGGVKFVTSGGSTEKVASAKNTIIYAVIGLIIVAFAQIIVQFVLSKASKAT